MTLIGVCEVFIATDGMGMWMLELNGMLKTNIQMICCLTFNMDCFEHGWGDLPVYHWLIASGVTKLIALHGTPCMFIYSAHSTLQTDGSPLKPIRYCDVTQTQTTGIMTPYAPSPCIHSAAWKIMRSVQTTLWLHIRPRRRLCYESFLHFRECPDIRQTSCCLVMLDDLI